MSTLCGNFIWKFGYGSNMSPSNLQNKKSINVIEQIPAYLPNWTLAFHNGGSNVEPAYATAILMDDYKKIASEAYNNDNNNIWIPFDNSRLPIYGLASKLSKEDAYLLDNQEGGDKYYDKKEIHAKTLQGDDITVEFYITKLPIEGRKPSRRYLNLMINGAKEINLPQEYISFLENIPANKASDHPQPSRELQRPEKLKSFTIEELAQYTGENKPKYKCAVGYIVQTQYGFDSWNARDVTFRNLLHFRGISLSKNDDYGKGPFPILNDLSNDEHEYIWQNLDSILNRNDAKLIGILKEFWEVNKDYKWKW